MPKIQYKKIPLSLSVRPEIKKAILTRARELRITPSAYCEKVFSLIFQSPSENPPELERLKDHDEIT